MKSQCRFKVGEVVRFKPHIEGLAGPDSPFFRKYAGQNAEVIELVRDFSGMALFRRMVRVTAEGMMKSVRRRAVSEKKEKKDEGKIDALKIKFSDGHMTSCALLHFRKISRKSAA